MGFHWTSCTAVRARVCVRLVRSHHTKHARVTRLIYRITTGLWYSTGAADGVQLLAVILHCCTVVPCRLSDTSGENFGSYLIYIVSLNEVCVCVLQSSHRSASLKQSVVWRIVFGGGGSTSTPVCVSDLINKRSREKSDLLLNILWLTRFVALRPDILELFYLRVISWDFRHVIPFLGSSRHVCDINGWFSTCYHDGWFLPLVWICLVFFYRMTSKQYVEGVVFLLFRQVFMIMLLRVCRMFGSLDLLKTKFRTNSNHRLYSSNHFYSNHCVILIIVFSSHRVWHSVHHVWFQSSCVTPISIWYSSHF